MWKIVICFLMIGACRGRIFETGFKIKLFNSCNGWVYLDKMVFSQGQMKVDLSMNIEGLPMESAVQMTLLIIKEQDWQREQETKCKGDAVSESLAVNVVLNGTEQHFTKAISVLEEKCYYFVLRECGGWRNDYANEMMTLRVVLHTLNNDRETGQEEDHWYIAVVVICGGMLMVHFYISEFKGKEIHWTSILLFGSMVAQTSALLWKNIGFVIYCHWGTDYFAFHLIYLFLHSISTSAVLILLNLVAYGFTLTFLKVEDLDIFVPMIAFIAFIHCVCLVLAKFGHSADSHHLYDSMGGTFIYTIHFILAFICLLGLINTFRQARPSLKYFIIAFGAFALACTLALPLTVFLADTFIHPHNRNQFVYISTEAVKFTANAFIRYMIANKNSYYSQVKYQNNFSFIPQQEQKRF